MSESILEKQYLEAFCAVVPKKLHKEPWFTKGKDFAADMDECRRFLIRMIEKEKANLDLYLHGLRRYGWSHDTLDTAIRARIREVQASYAASRSKVLLLLELNMPKDAAAQAFINTAANAFEGGS